MPADKDEVKARNDIVDVIGTFVQLKKRGRNHVGLCPFHQEKTPSFNVDQTTQTFKCFGCGEGGDIFTFVEKYQNMSFVEAAEFLARRAGLILNRQRGQSPEQLSEREKMLALNEMAAKFFEDRIQKVDAALRYLLERGLSVDTIRRFRLGLAPEGWDKLAGFLQSRRQDLKLAVEAGLLKRGETGDVYDVFRNRVMFPILDEQERVVAFGGRAMGEDQPKYLNTGETPLFSKSKLLYGLPYARRRIASEEQVLLMEGYTDVIAAHQAGFTHSVATLGTSLTEDHARKLARLAPTVVLVYDGDRAGIKATLRASETLEREQMQVKVARIPSGEDPDSMLNKGNVAGFQRAINEAIGRVEYQLERAIAETDAVTTDGKELLQRRLLHILSTVQTATERDQYIEHVWKIHPLSRHGLSIVKDQMHRDITQYARRNKQPAQRSQVTTGAVGGVLSESGIGERSTGRRPGDGWKRERGWQPHPKEYVRPIKAGSSHVSSEDRAERELLRALIEPEWRTSVLKVIAPDDFISEDAKRFARFIQENQKALEEDGSDWISLLDRSDDTEFSLRIRQLLQEIRASSPKVPVSEAAIKGCALTIKRQREIGVVQRNLLELLQGKPVLSAEDQEQLKAYQAVLKRLKGSNPTEGVQGE